VPADDRSERGQAAEDQRGAHREPRCEGGSCSPSPASGTHGADHREASGRPGAGEADEQAGEGEAGGQHLIFVS
jgi:hypothetical protein